MKFIPQFDQMDCGPACLCMISNNYGKDYPLKYIRDISYITNDGVSLLGLNDAAEQIGFETFPTKLSIEELKKNLTQPTILHWKQGHFVILHKIKKRKKPIYNIIDPGYGFISINEEEFKKSWCKEEGVGVALFLSPTEKFHELSPPKQKNKSIFFEIFKYLKPYKKEVVQLFLGLLIGSLITLIFPFLTQKVIDEGIENKKLDIVFLLLLAQVFLFIGSTVIEIIRNWITLYIGTRINISILSDFLHKILRLPIKFFDTKVIGDFQQRIQDHERIEQFLTSQSLITLFSFINFSIFFLVLLHYDTEIVISYSILTFLSILWSIMFLKKRKILDYYLFQKKGENQESIYELINGIQEIKLNDFEDYKKEEWKSIQLKLFKINLRVLKLDQYQLTGFRVINQLKNIFVTYIAAREVIHENITLGGLLAISYIIGQMNSPINQIINFFRSLQDAKLSFERLMEVEDHEDEEQKNQIKFLKKSKLDISTEGIKIDKLNYQYEGPKSPYVLRNINLFIPKGKVTAIVGASGSGKTTLMKLLLKFYEPTIGSILINQDNLSHISPKSWRNNCGAVMQDGYIFSDSIKQNIITGDKNIDIEKLNHAIKTANIESFINSLPLKLNTKIGASGNGISGGERQRILIARAIYKNPEFVFFDEATSALDAENESVIHNNLQTFFNNKTAVIIAHRLSTVKNADQIIVLNKGEVVEQGIHSDLINKKGNYYRLIKNQLELGN